VIAVPEQAALEKVRDAVASGVVSAATLGDLYAIASEAVQRADVDTLTVAHELAQRLLTTGDEQIRVQAAQLLIVFGEFFDRIGPSAGAPTTTCSGCGRELDGSPVRCRFCGELLI
jgi:hypothetical protein